MSLLYEAFRRGTNPIVLYRNLQRQRFLLSGTRSISMKRDLVQWNLTQMREHNIETNGEYLSPLLSLKQGNDSWSTLTAGLSPEELADMEKARSNL